MADEERIKGLRERRLSARRADLLARTWELLEDDPDVRETTAIATQADLETKSIPYVHGLMVNFYGIANEDRRLLDFLFRDYQRWLDSRFELQVWHYTLKQDEDDDTIYMPDQPIHHRDRSDKQGCMVCRGEGGTEVAHVYDQYGSLVGKGDEFGLDEALDLNPIDLGYGMSQHDLLVITEIVEAAFR